MKLDRATAQLRPYLPGIPARDLEFSKDKHWVAYTTWDKGELWRSRVDGTQRLKLISDPTRPAISPCWSSDDRQIAFLAFSGAEGYKIYTVPSQGGEPALLVDINGLLSTFDWSPDGKKIAYAPVTYENPIEKRKLCIYDLASKKTSILEDSYMTVHPRWFPDGRSLLANGDKLKQFDLKTKTWRELCGEVAGQIRISGDGQYVYYLRSPKPDSLYISRLHLSSRKVENLYDLAGTKIFTFTSVGWIGLTPEDEPLIMRDTSMAEIYSYNWIAP